ncbi:hypothetical protein AA313_de0201643 [Arthrobotrys entomopaga]|nr:hypothetical protein AA313_de0201643 [Arthrobotrys entomopaga]
MSRNPNGSRTTWSRFQPAFRWPTGTTEKTTRTTTPVFTPPNFESSAKGSTKLGHETVISTSFQNSSAGALHPLTPSKNEQTQNRGTNLENWSPEALYTHASRSSNEVNRRGVLTSRAESELGSAGARYNAETTTRRPQRRMETRSSGGLRYENPPSFEDDGTRNRLKGSAPSSTSTRFTREPFSTLIPVETEPPGPKGGVNNNDYTITTFERVEKMVGLMFGKRGDADTSRLLVMITTSVAFLTIFWMTLRVRESQVGLTPSSPIIAIMGETGAGKSSFIKALGGLNQDGQPPAVGHNLNSTTKSVSWYSAAIGQRGFYVLDTPGFDDSYMSDFEILESLTRELAQIYTAARPLTGIIYVHDVSKEKMGGTSHKSLKTFQKLVGDTSLKNVVLVTTHWRNFFYSAQQQREEELRRTFWASMIARGSEIVSHDGSRKSARRIVQNMLNRKPITIKIVDEMVNDGKRFEQTEAGSTVKEGLGALGQKLDSNVQALNDEIYDLRTKQKQIEQAAAHEKKVLEEQWKRSSQNQRREIEKKMKDLEVGLEEQMRGLNDQLLNIQKEKEGMQTHIDELKRANKVLQDKLDQREQTAQNETKDRQSKPNKEKKGTKPDRKSKRGQKPRAPGKWESFVWSCLTVLMWFYGFASPMLRLGPWPYEPTWPFLYFMFLPLLGIFSWFVGEVDFLSIVVAMVAILVEGIVCIPGSPLLEPWRSLLAGVRYSLALRSYYAILSSILAMVQYVATFVSYIATVVQVGVFLVVLVLLSIIVMQCISGGPSTDVQKKYL